MTHSSSAILLLLTGMLSVHRNANAGTLRLAVVCPMDGYHAASGRDMFNGIALWADQVNTGKTPLLIGGESFDVVLKTFNTNSDAAYTAATIAPAVIAGWDSVNATGTAQPYHAVVGCHSAYVPSISDNIQAAGIPSIHCSGGPPTLWNRGKDWSFGIHVPSTDYPKDFLRNKALQGKKKVGLIRHSTNGFTKSTCISAVNEALSRGLEVVGPSVAFCEKWSATTSCRLINGKCRCGDKSEGTALSIPFDPEQHETFFEMKPGDRGLGEGGMMHYVKDFMDEMKAADVDVVLGCNLVVDGYDVVQGAIDAAIDLDGLWVSVAPSKHKFLSDFGPNGTDGLWVSWPAQWNPMQKYSCPVFGSSAAYAERSIELFADGIPSYDRASCSAVGASMHVALSKYTTGPEFLGQSAAAQRQALRSGLTNLFDEIFFGITRFNKFNQNNGHSPATVQVVPDETGMPTQMPVFPSSSAKVAFYEPMPTWESRRGCAVGKQLAEDSAGVRCEMCPPGLSRGIAGTPVALQYTGSGFAVSNSATNRCMMCAAGTGTLAHESGSSTCSPCAPGTQQDGQRDAGVCTACALGTFRPVGSADLLCAQCPPGTFSGGLGATNCTQCPPGTYQSLSGSASCKACPKGTASGASGLEICEACPVSTYSGAEGLQECVYCEAGLTTLFRGSANASECTCPTKMVMKSTLGLAPPQTKSCLACNDTTSSGVICTGGLQCTDMPGKRFVDPVTCDGEPLCAVDSCANHCVVLRQHASQVCADPSKKCLGWSGLSSANVTVGNDALKQVLLAAVEHFAFDVAAVVVLGKGKLVAGDGWVTSGLPSLCPHRQDQVDAPAMLGQGFWADPALPAAVYRCTPEASCPGGNPGTCARGRGGQACARCLTGYYRQGVICVECDGSSSVAVGAVFAIIPIGILFLYYFSNSKMTAKASGTLTTALSFGMIFNTLQVFALIAQMSIDWYNPFGVFMEICNIFLFDLDALRWECGFQLDPLGKYVFRSLFPALVLGSVFVLYVASMAWPERRLDKNKMLNVVGQLTQVFFIPMIMNGILPFQCINHPVGTGSILRFPDVECGGADYGSFVAVGLVSFAIFPLNFAAFCVYAIWMAPVASRSDESFLIRWRFLFARFRTDRYAWGVVLLVRNLLLSLVPVVDPNNPLTQSTMMGVVLLLGICLQSRFWAWRTDTLNITDTITLVGISIITLVGVAFIDTRTVSFEGASTFILVVAVLLVVWLFVVTAQSVFRIFRPEQPSQLEEEMAEMVVDFVCTMNRVEEDHIRRVCSTMAPNEMRDADKGMSIISQAVGVDQKSSSLRSSSHRAVSLHRKSATTWKAVQRRFSQSLPAVSGEEPYPLQDREEMEV